MMKKGLVQRFLALPFSVRQSVLAKNRPPLSRTDFVASITRAGGDADAANLVHYKLKDWIYDGDFTSYPEDSFRSVFGIAEEELDEDMILDLLEKLDISAPPRLEVMAFGPIDTATDVARFVARARKGERRSGGTILI